MIRFPIILILCLIACLAFTRFARSGDCLDSRGQMLRDLKHGIEYSIANPDAKKVDFGPWIDRCWFASPWRDDESMDDELAETLLWAIKHVGVPPHIRVRVLQIARNAAPHAMFAELMTMLEEGKIPESELAAEVVLRIWARYWRTDPSIATLDCAEFVRAYIPSVFDQQQVGALRRGGPLFRLHHALVWAFPNDYIAARRLLEKLGLLGRPSEAIRFFNDPRAWEDIAYSEVQEEDMFYSLAGHLELVFTKEWIQFLAPHQPRMLRNGILATYGYRCKDAKLRSFFATGITKFCRNGQCGILFESYEDSLLTEVDRTNIALIRQVESETR